MSGCLQLSLPQRRRRSGICTGTFATWSSLENPIPQRVRRRRRRSFGEAPRWRAGRAGSGCFRSQQFQYLTVFKFLHYDTTQYLKCASQGQVSTSCPNQVSPGRLAISNAGLWGRSIQPSATFSPMPKPYSLTVSSAYRWTILHTTPSPPLQSQHGAHHHVEQGNSSLPQALYREGAVPAHPRGSGRVNACPLT